MANDKPLGAFGSYLRARGYNPASSAEFLRRLFWESWQQPGFHHFWKVWNPVYGFFLWKLYVYLGGTQRPILSTVSVFLVCGFLFHDCVVWAATGELGLTVTFAFALYAVFTLLARLAEPHLDQRRWPKFINAIINVALLATGLVAGAWLNHLAFKT